VVLVQLDPPDDPGVTLDHFRLGAALVEAGQRDEYERFRQETVSRFGNASSAVNTLPDRPIRTCLMLPANRELLESLRPAADAAERELAGGFPEREPWISSALALLEYRRGDDLKAAAFCTRCLNSRGANGPPGALARVVLALASWRLDKHEEGLATLKQAEEQIDLAFNKGLGLNLHTLGGYWFDWVLARILLREGQEQIL
jgi:hypothetical protein